MLYFHISEDEYNALESAMSQLGVLVGLLEIAPGKKTLQSINVDGLYNFVNTQFSALRAITNAVEVREGLTCEPDQQLPLQKTTKRSKREKMVDSMA
ncbi:hypothetical protein [Comamonas testosteroni]|uniref:hypothetical protein n=1 Tax=Comamonas testosteroni TaxID=285 RepID=UPI0006B97627|nr:hypothetical protein [Comamonas testosteroni]